MSLRTLLTVSLIALLASTSRADTAIVDDDFESYADDNALYSAWVPSNANMDGILTSEALDPGLFPGIQGQGVDHIGGSVMQNVNLAPGSEVFPSATEAVRVEGDIYVGNDGNSRTSIGLRNSTNLGNLLELGTYQANEDSIDPLTGVAPDPLPPVTTYAYRIVLFDSVGGDLVAQPNWGFFEFDLALDIEDNDPGTTEPTPDGDVGPEDIGPGWHTYIATITPDTLTLEVDLFRDDVTNLTRDQDGNIEVGVGDRGVDASITLDIITGAQGFDSLRIGSPSGISSANGVAFDNLSLREIDGDADGDGDVDGNDYLKYQSDEPALIPLWEQYYPRGVELVSAAIVPEPGSFALAGFAAAVVVALRRR